MLVLSILQCLGDAAVAQVVLSRETKGTFLTINLAFAFAIAFGVYICGGVSGKPMCQVLPEELRP